MIQMKEQSEMQKIMRYLNEIEQRSQKDRGIKPPKTKRTIRVQLGKK